MKCILCNAPINKIRVVIFKKKKFEIAHCTRCDLEFDKHIKKTTQEYYEDLYQTWNVAGINIRGLIWGNKQFFENTKSKSHSKKSLVLDIGCADGLFVQEAIKKGYNAHGIDINPQLIKAAKDYFGIKTVYYGELPSIKKHVKEKFQYITFFDVLEHLENPKKYIEQLKRYLTPKGKIFVSIPNRYCSPHFLPIDGDLPPHHLTWWSQKSLQYIFETSGFKVIYYKVESVNSKDMAVWFDNILTNTLPFFRKAKASVQKQSLATDNEIQTKLLYSLKSLELDILSIIFYIPAKILTLTGATGTAQCILAELK